MTTDLIMPVIILLIITTGFAKKVPMFSCFTDGAADGLKTMVSIAPSLIGLITAIGMLLKKMRFQFLTQYHYIILTSLHANY